MAVDKVKPLGLEEIDDGNQTVPIPTEMNPTEDYAAVKGVAFENSDNTLIDSESGNIKITTNGIERSRYLLSGELGLNTTTPNTILDVNGDFATRQSVSAASGTINNLSTDNISFLHFTNNSGPIISGFANGSDGKHLIILYTGTGYLSLLNQSLSSSVNNRLSLNNNLNLFQNQSIHLIYNTTLNRWVFAQKQQRTFPVQFQFVGQMNFNQYLYSWQHDGSGSRRSSEPSNGWQFSNSSPILCPFNGTIRKVMFRNRGIAQSTGTPAANMTLRYELWNVGVAGGQGTKLGDVNITFATASLTIGNFGNSAVNTNFTGTIENLGIQVTAGQLLALKFITQTGNSNVVSVHNALISLEIEGY
jgi:hypothetical protein